MLYTTSQAGPWSQSSTWGGIGPPGNTDTASVTHAVTVDVNTTVGRSLQGAGWSKVGIAATGGSGSATSLPTGNYLVAYTMVDGSGNETSIGLTESSSLALVNGTSIPLITFPAAPPATCTYNLYLTNTGGTSGTEHLYATGITTATYGATFQSQWNNNTQAYSASSSFPPFLGTCAVVISSAGSITVNADIAFTVRGDINHNGSTFTMSHGSSLVFDPTQCGSSAKRAQAQYVWNPVQSSNSTFTINGTQIDQCSIYTLRTNGDEGTAYFAMPAATSSVQGILSANWCNFTDIGNSSTLFGVITRDEVTSGTTSYSIMNCIFTRANYQAIIAGSSWDGTFDFQYNKFLSSTAVTVAGWQVCMQYSIVSTPVIGTRMIDSIAFDIQASLKLYYTQFSNSLCPHTITNVQGGWNSDSYFYNNIVFIHAADNGGEGIIIYGPWKSCYFFGFEAGGNHMTSVGTGTGITAYTITGCIWDGLAVNGNGDGIIIVPNVTGTTLKVIGNILVPTLVSDQANNTIGPNDWTNNILVTAEHNTTFCCGKGASGAYFGESVAPAANTLASYRSNLFANYGGASRAWALQNDSHVTTDIVAIADGVTYFGAGNNWYYNPSTGTCTCVLNSGTVTTSTVFTAVVGVSTLFLAELQVGSVIQTTGGVVIGTVASITDNTHLTFTGNAASNNAGIAWQSTSPTVGFNALSISSKGFPNAQIGTADRYGTTSIYDPKFIDSTRCMGSWGQLFLGASAGSDNGVTETMTLLGASPQSLATNITSMMIWVRSGFLVTNPELANFTYTGDTYTTDQNGNPQNGAPGAMGFADLIVFRPASLSGVGGGGPFFGDPVARS